MKKSIAGRITAIALAACMVLGCAPAALAGDGILICTKKEHTHTDECYEKNVICGKEESEGHTHTEDCYTDEVLVCETEESTGHTHTDECYEKGDLTCTLTEHVHGEGCYEVDGEEDIPVLLGSPAPVKFKGSGTEEEPYLIETADDLKSLAEAVNDGETFEGMYFSLEDDIDLECNEEEPWTPIGKNADGDYPYVKTGPMFKGIFDGNNNTISGIYVNESSNSAGLFGVLGGKAVIKNLTVEGTVIGTNYVGGICGNAYGSNKILIENCINNCSVSGGESYLSCVGGITGYATNTQINNCVNNGNIENSKHSTGGICGVLNASSADSCFNRGNVKSSNYYTGGIGGQFYNGGTVSNCKNIGCITGDRYVGGITGYCNNKIENCENSGMVIGDRYVGGITGSIYKYTKPSLVNNLNIGTVKGVSETGAIYGGATGGSDAPKEEDLNISGNKYLDGSAVLNNEKGGTAQTTEDIKGDKLAVTFKLKSDIYALLFVDEGDTLGDFMPYIPEGYEKWVYGDEEEFTAETEVTEDVTVNAFKEEIEIVIDGPSEIIVPDMYETLSIGTLFHYYSAKYYRNGVEDTSAAFTWGIETSDYNSNHVSMSESGRLYVDFYAQNDRVVIKAYAGNFEAEKTVEIIRAESVLSSVSIKYNNRTISYAEENMNKTASKYIKVPKDEGTVTEKQFTASFTDQYFEEMQVDDAKWTVSEYEHLYIEPTGVTVDNTGKVTVTSEAEAGTSVYLKLTAGKYTAVVRLDLKDGEFIDAHLDTSVKFAEYGDEYVLMPSVIYEDDNDGEGVTWTYETNMPGAAVSDDGTKLMLDETITGRDIINVTVTGHKEKCDDIQLVFSVYMFRKNITGYAEVDVADKPYDGGMAASADAVFSDEALVNDDTLTNGVDYTVHAVFKSPEEGENKPVVVNIKFKGEADDKYYCSSIEAKADITAGEEGDKLESPVITPKVDEFAGSVKVSITAEEGADIYYAIIYNTGDEEAIDRDWGYALYSGELTIENTSDVRAFAVKAGFKDSNIVSEHYEKKTDFDVTVSGSYADGHGGSGYTNTYKVGETVEIYSGQKSGNNFKGIRVNGIDEDEVILFDEDDKENRRIEFVMPENNVTVEFLWKSRSISEDESTGGSAGGGSVTKYSVKADADIKNGAVDINKTSASKGTEVTVKAKADEGYELYKITVTDRNGNIIELTKADGGEYAFTMPGADVTVYAAFKEKAVNNGENGDGKPEFKFSDVNDSDWFAPAVYYVYSKGIMGPAEDDKFMPYLNVTRGMMVTMLYRLEGEPAVKVKAAFADVKEDAYYAEAVAWAAENNIAAGYDKFTYGPDDIITREQLAAMLYRYAVWKGMDVSVGENTNILSYNDAFDISQYAVPAMQWACGTGIISGNGAGMLAPKAGASRAEAAQMLMVFCKIN